MTEAKANFETYPCKPVIGLRPWERGRPARNAALARGDTLILAFSHKGRRDPLTAIYT